MTYSERERSLKMDEEEVKLKNKKEDNSKISGKMIYKQGFIATIKSDDENERI